MVALAQGRELLAIPGPSALPDRVIRAMTRPSVNIYEGEIVALTDGLLRDLSGVARTAAPAFIYIANGHGAWEAALANTLSRGDRVLALESGRFAVGWGETAGEMGVEVEVLPARPRRAVDPNALEDRLRRDARGEIRAVLTVQVDTASSLANDIPAIRAAIDAAGHPALLMVDAIASMACAPFEMDAWGVDVTVGASQKGLMTPPGLGFVWAGERAMAAHRAAGLRSRYWDWSFRLGVEQYRRFCGTAPTHLLFGLRAALDMLAEEGIATAWARHAALARAVRAAAAAWAEGGAVAFHALDPAERAASVTTLLCEGVDADRLRALWRDRMGLVLGVGLGDLDGRAFRVGHMGWVNAATIMGALGAAQAGLLAAGARIGEGGLDAAAREIAAAAKG